LPDPIERPAPGDLIWIRRDRWRVQSAHADAGLYQVDATRSGDTHAHTFLLPVEPWWPDTARRLRPVSAQLAHAWLAGCVARLSPAHTPSTIVRTSTTLLAYQLEPALAVLSGVRRVLIADTVGLGKTVQAALIIAELLARRAEGRVLVLAPAPLLRQWADELATRFQIRARIAEPETFARLRAEHPYLTNPWSGCGVWLASPDYVKQPHVLGGIPRETWDVVVIDEAHTMSGDSMRAEAAHAIAHTATHVVLLTATPHDGDQARLTRLISLGGTGAAGDFLLTFRRTRPSSSRRVTTLQLAPGAAVTRVLAAVDAYERAARPAADHTHRDALHLICTLFRKRVLSSLAAFVASVDRRLEWVSQRTPVDCWEQLALFADDVVAAEEVAALTADAGMPASREQSWLTRLRHIAEVRSAQCASATVRSALVRSAEWRLQRLCTLLRRVGEPVVIFTEYRDTLMAAAAALSAERRLAVLHGGLAPVEQRRAVRAFCEGAADTLLATDVASQGLNLQSRARWVICLDLPWTPMRLEQRIGRVDRIGQTRRVHVTLLHTRHSADSDLRARVTQRQDAVASLALPSCQRWTRAAHSLVALFTRQRALAARWRGPDPVDVPRARVSATLLRAVTGEAGPPASPVTIVDVSLVSDMGDVVERHLAWHPGLPRQGSGAGSGAALTMAPTMALPTALQRRVRVLDARARRHAARQVAARGEATRPAPTQRGLFEPRMEQARPPTQTATQTPTQAAGAEPRSARVSAGAARPLLVLECRGSRR
jgi:superfamily II DNA or RNA helicase